jgi:Carboxypeptidase regulatory-like domain
MGATILAMNLRLAALVAFAALLALFPATSAAATYGDVVVSVVDATDSHPVSGASITIYGAEPYSALTDRNGRAEIDDVPPGSYSLSVAARAYHLFTVAHLVIGNGEEVSTTVRLAPLEQPPVIATVSVNSARPGTLRSDPLQALPAEMRDLLGPSGSTPSDALSNLAINGHDPLGTSLSIDGVPLNLPRFSAGPAAQGLTPDLFVGADVTGIPQNGFAGGTTNLTTIYPTLSWQSALHEELDSYGGGAAIANVSGTAGFLGLAAQVATRQTNGPLNGDSFLDGSGLFYSHDQNAQRSGVALTAQGAIGDNQLTATVLSANGSQSLLCLTELEQVPCGYGPGNEQMTNVSAFSVHDTTSLRGTDIDIRASHVDANVNDNYDNRIINGVPNPYAYILNNSVSNISVNASHSLGQRDVLSFSAGASSESTTIQSGIDYAALTTSPSSASFGTATLADLHRFDNKTSIIPRFALSGGANYSDFTSGLTLTRRFSSEVSAQGGIENDVSTSTIASTYTAPDPYSLQFSCSSATAYGEGPLSAPSGRQQSTSAQASVAYEQPTYGLSVSGFADNQLGVAVTAPVSSTAFAPGVLPPSFFSEAETLYSSASYCPSAGVLLPQNIFLSQTINGIHGSYDGASVRGYLRYSRTLFASALYDVTSARDITSSALLQNSQSTIVDGAQLPNVPIQTASVTIGYANSGTAAIVNFQYVARNNQNNLPAYSFASAGASARVGVIRLSLLGENLFNSYAGVFASPLNAVPLQTNIGGPIQPLAQPLAP